MEEYLSPTYYIDSDHPSVNEFASKNCDGDEKIAKKAVQLYYAVRDDILYNPYSIDPSKESMKASAVLNKGYGYCAAKAVLLTACARSQQIPARLGFADVKNHLTTKRLRSLMGTDVFVYHGYTEFFLNNKWIKATPTFNLTLCNNFNVKPLEFDGTKDSIFHPFNKSGNMHMEYVKERGTFSDLPWEVMLAEMMKSYPVYFEDFERHSKNFSTEALNQKQPC